MHLGPECSMENVVRPIVLSVNQHSIGLYTSIDLDLYSRKYYVLYTYDSECLIGASGGSVTEKNRNLDISKNRNLCKYLEY
jgi:hypothetical protein